MKELRILQVLDFFQGFFRFFKVDYQAMRSILEVKLTMDQRRIPTVFQANGTKPKEGNQFLKMLGIYVLYSLLIVPFLFFGDAYMFQMSIIFGIAFFILMTAMISDFSAVLLDVRDKVILHTKPVDARTISAAKMMHVFIYMFLMTGSFIAIPSVVMLAQHGPLILLLFLFEMFMALLFIIALTAMIYMVILHLFNGEKLKDIINYVQIFMAIGIFIGYQIVARMFNVVEMDLVYTFEWWHVFIPPMWFGAPFEWLFNHHHSPGISIMAILTVIVPIIAIYLYYRLMPSFEQNLKKLMNVSITRKKKSRWTALAEKVCCKSKEERAYFKFASSLIRRERDFKLRVYPSLGLAIVFPFIFMFNQMEEGGFQALGETKQYFFIYFSLIIISTVVHMLQYSERYNGAWIFHVTPSENPKRLYSATLKAFLVQLFFPIYLLLSIIFVFIFSYHIILDLIIIGITAILYTLSCYKIITKVDYPFSKKMESASQGGMTILYFLLMFVVGVFTVIHFVVSLVPYGSIIYMLILAFITWVSWAVVFRKKPAN